TGRRGHRLREGSGARIRVSENSSRFGDLRPTERVGMCLLRLLRPGRMVMAPRPPTSEGGRLREQVGRSGWLRGADVPMDNVGPGQEGAPRIPGTIGRGGRPGEAPMHLSGGVFLALGAIILWGAAAAPPRARAQTRRRGGPLPPGGGDPPMFDPMLQTAYRV